MKIYFTLLVAFLLTLSCFAQTGFNYKAAIKDTNGNLLISQDIDVRFTLQYVDVEFGTQSYYEEIHNTTTDANGIIILNIGEGNIVFGSFPQNSWDTTTTLLVGIDIETDGTFVTLPTTDFKKVPMANRADYATQAITADTALNVSGLETVTESNTINNTTNTGWRLIGSDPNNYGPIGNNAVDLSTQDFTSSTTGANGGNSFASGLRTTASGINSVALGDESRAYGMNSVAMGNESTTYAINSVAMGDNTRASGANSIAMGNDTTAFGVNSTAMGDDTTASGSSSTAMGEGSYAIGNHSAAIGNRTRAYSFSEIAIGSWNTEYSPDNISDWNLDDRLFVIGNGADSNTRNDALIVYKNGNAKFDAEIQTTSTGNANMIPIAYGTVESNGNILTGTGNFTVAAPEPPTFQIEVTGETLNPNNSTILVTPLAGNFRTASTTYNSGDVRVYIFNSSGTQVTNTFQFVIYKL